MPESDRKSISDAEYKELADVFPALEKYKSDHTEKNLEKLCVEIAEFIRMVYASTRNERERDIFRKMIQKLNK